MVFSSAKIDSISSNVKKVTDNFNNNVDFTKFADILDRINSTSESIESLSKTLDLTVKQSREDISASMINLRQALENVNELSRLLREDPSLILRGEKQKQRRLK